jgi:hypothetical protein
MHRHSKLKNLNELYKEYGEALQSDENCPIK